jgi:6-pyruvoyltetrahydropterin/6-carboxytetrahydropterin synthase
MSNTYIISKDFEFSYGHRVWTQTLNGEYSDNLKTSCRHIHGHEAKVTVSLSADRLVDGMVTDFRHLEWLKTFLNTFVDHQFVIDRNDPLYNRLVGDVKLTAVQVPGRDMVAGYIVDPEEFKKVSPAEKEMLEGIFVVNFVPTSENLSHWLSTVVAEKMKDLNVQVNKIVWWESPKSRSEYYA